VTARGQRRRPGAVTVACRRHVKAVSRPLGGGRRPAFTWGRRATHNPHWEQRADTPRHSSAKNYGFTPALTTFAFGLELSVLDVEEFERTAAFLTPEVVARSLRTIAERCVALQRGLRAPDAVARAGTRLADAAHALAGSAGMFGFERLAAARGFERAVQTGAEEASDLAHNLNAALETASAKIRKIFCDI